MSELVLSLLRLSYLVLLWLLVLWCINALRRDVFGTRVAARTAGKKGLRRRSPPVAAEDDGEEPSARSVPVTLLVLEGPLRGTQLSLSTSAVLIGRAPSCTLVVDDDYASGRHARIFPHDGRWFVEDLGSTNGTWLGEERVGDAVPMELNVPLRVGKTVLELRL